MLKLNEIIKNEKINNFCNDLDVTWWKPTITTKFNGNFPQKNILSDLHWEKYSIRSALSFRLLNLSDRFTSSRNCQRIIIDKFENRSVSKIRLMLIIHFQAFLYQPVRWVSDPLDNNYVNPVTNSDISKVLAISLGQIFFSNQS